MVYNFYKQLRDNADELERLLKSTLYSREDFLKCLDIYQGKVKASEMEKARAFFVVCNQSFAGACLAFGFSKQHKRLCESFKYKSKSMSMLKKRMESVQIENLDAIKIIKKYDDNDAFFYIDPPYPGTNQAQYSGYSMDDFNKLTDCLLHIKGKFALSCYLKPEMVLSKKWKIVKKKTICRATGVRRGGKKPLRQESLIMNY